MGAVYDWWVSVPSLVRWVVTVVLVGVGVGATGNELHARLSGRIRVEIVSSTKGWQFRQFRDLYEELIAEPEQVPVTSIAHYVESPRSSPRTLRRLGRAIRASSLTEIHLLLVAHRRKEVTSFLKVVICDEARCAFIAYLGSSNAHATQQLLEYFTRKAVRRIPPVKFVAYEVAASNPHAESNLRRFSAYASDYGATTFRYDDYLQPDMNAARIRHSVEESATLLVVRLGGTAVPPSRSELVGMLRAIYFGIYGDTVAATTHLSDEYRLYLADLADVVATELEKATF